MHSRRPSKFTSLVSVTITLLSAAGVIASDSTTNLKQLETRHEWLHSRVAPAVVAVQSKGDRRDSGFYGTGVVISADGLVLTSTTVVPSNARLVQIFFTDGRVFDARVVASKVQTEACLLQAIQDDEKVALPYVELCDSARINVGELAYTAGNPFHTISRDGQVAWSVGVVSGKYKMRSADEQSRYNGLVLETDAAVNPGSDGGPLIDANGRLLGLLSLSYNESRWLGTAIPTHLIKQSLKDDLKAVELFDPAAAIKNAVQDSAARAIPDSLRAASSTVASATVKLFVTRPNSQSRRDDRALPTKRLQQRPNAPCTGVIIDPKGYVLTSAFNVDGDSARIEAQLHDGRRVSARVLGRNYNLDIAVLKLTPQESALPSISLESSPKLLPGRFVAVLGASEDSVEPTTTMGIVSALGRLDGTAVQTDALINYGNCGGPVIDLHGRLIGIACQVKTHSDWSQQNSGVGFFCKSDMVLACIDELKGGRDIQPMAHAFLGVSPADSGPEIDGVVLGEITQRSPAENANLKSGDIITSLCGKPIDSWSAMVRMLKQLKPGESIEIIYKRGTNINRTSTVLTSRPPEL